MKFNISMGDRLTVVSAVNQAIKAEMIANAEKYKHLNSAEKGEIEHQLRQEAYALIDRWTLLGCAFTIQVNTEMKTVMVAPNYDKI